MSFTHLEAGTDEDAWQGAVARRAPPELDLPEHARLVVVGAHPDDESLGAGALMALAHRRGWAIDVIVATDGEASHPHSPTHAPERLRARRREEVAEALRALAPSARLHLLGLPDGALASARDPLRDRLDAVLADGEGSVLVAPWCEDGHTDHEAIGALAHELAASRGLRLIEYPIWLWHWAAPDSPRVPWERLRALRPDATARGAKRAAMTAHRSQTHPLSELPGDEALLSPAVQRHFQRDEEIYVEHDRALPAAFFEEFYDGNPDPWGFETRWYEERKRALTLASLPRRTFRRALEVGCATGVLTAALAGRAESLLAIDIAEAPLARARQRVASPGVAFGRYATPREWPDGVFELIVLSEVGYYWGAELQLGIERMLAALPPQGVLLACHWRHPVAEYPLTGDQVHEALRERSELVRVAAHVEEDFLLDVFTRPPAISVARRTGLVR